MTGSYMVTLIDTETDDQLQVIVNDKDDLPILLSRIKPTFYQVFNVEFIGDSVTFKDFMDSLGDNFHLNFGNDVNEN